jgi:hypothetical protein
MFRVSLAKLDIRQESDRHTEALDAITKYLGLLQSLHSFALSLLLIGMRRPRLIRNLVRGKETRIFGWKLHFHLTCPPLITRRSTPRHATAVLVS